MNSRAGYVQKKQQNTFSDLWVLAQGPCNFGLQPYGLDEAPSEKGWA